VNVKELLQLEVKPQEKTATLNAIEDNCTVLGFLYGGAALAAAIETLESVTARPLILATCQFNNFVKAGACLELNAEETVRGRNVCHTNLEASINKEPAFKVLASFGERIIDTQTQWIAMPNLDKPENCPTFGSGKVKEGKPCIDRRIDFRVARGSLRKDKKVDGQMALWARVPELDKTSASSIALMADYLPVSAGSMLARPAGGNSLDNSLRILQIEQSEWLLCDCEVRGIQNGFGHATMNIWSEKGILLAVASQSFIFRDFNAK
jgi:acyl-CoA thioesterase